MQKICRESEASLDYYSLFKPIMKRVPVTMSPLESLASSAVRTAHKVSLHIPTLKAWSLSLRQRPGFLKDSSVLASSTFVLLDPSEGHDNPLLASVA